MTAEAGDFASADRIEAKISLSAEVWDRLTASLRDDDRDAKDDSSLPDTPLEVRIALFLEMQLTAWEGSVTDIPSTAGSGGDLNDDLPF